MQHEWSEWKDCIKFVKYKHKQINQADHNKSGKSQINRPHGPKNRWSYKIADFNKFITLSWIAIYQCNFNLATVQKLTVQVAQSIRKMEIITSNLI